MEDFEMEMIEVVMGDQMAMAETAATRTGVLQQGMTVGAHSKNLVIIDPETGKERMADVNDAADMELVRVQEAEGREAMEKKAKEVGGKRSVDPRTQKNVLFGRGLRAPVKPQELGFSGELRGIWPPAAVTMFDYFKNNEHVLQAQGMQSIVLSYVTGTSLMAVGIRGYDRPFSSTTLETYATLLGYLQVLTQGQATPGDADADDMFAVLQSETDFDRLLLTAFKSRAQHMTLPQLEHVAHRMFSYKHKLEEETREKGKATEETMQLYQDDLRLVSEHIYSSLLWHNRPLVVGERQLPAPEFSEEQLAQLKEHKFHVLKSSDLGQRAVQEGTAVPYTGLAGQEGGEESAIVTICIRSYPTPEWFKGVWRAVLALLGNESPVEVPPDLPVWCDESVLVSVTARVVMFYYHYVRGMESSYITNHVLPVFYGEVEKRGADAVTPESVFRVRDELAKYTQTTLRLLELCILFMLAQVLDVQDKELTSKIAYFYDMIGPRVDDLKVVVGFDEGQENCHESPNFHLNPATVNSAVIEQTVACKNAVDLVRKDAALAPHVDTIIKKLNEPQFVMGAWMPSPLYVAFFALGAHYMNRAFVNKDPEGKANIEIFYAGCKKDIQPYVESVKMAAMLEDLNTKQQREQQELSEQQSKSKRKAERTEREEAESELLDDESEAARTDMQE